MKSTNTLQHCTFIPSYDQKRLPLNFVLCDCPPVDHLAEYAKFFAKHLVICVCRICDSSNYKAGVLLELLQKQYKTDTYGSQSDLNNVGLFESSVSPAECTTKVGTGSHQLCLNDGCHFEDGGVPSAENILNWLNMIDHCISQLNQHKALIHSDSVPAIAVHCVSGLGRAPVLIAIAVMEYCTDLDALDVVQWLRTYRRGAFNNNQLHWLENEYSKKLRRKYHSKKRKPNANGSGDIAKSSQSLASGEQVKRSKFSLKRMFKNAFKSGSI